MDEREAYIALNMMEKIGPVGVDSLVRALGSAVAIFDCGRRALEGTGVLGGTTLDTLVGQRNAVDWAGEIERAAALGARIVSRIDEEYPRGLKEIHDPPLALYVRGTLESRDARCVAVVGTRRPTHYGRDTAASISSQLARLGFTVASGLALGIDTHAHEAALRADGRTIAVIGSGLDRIYPEQNIGLAEKIAEHGAVISEFPLGRWPDKTTFPMRNRIVSGLSMGVLVVEAGEKSGALITANQALQQGRSVFAVPGRIDSRASRGTNGLIKGGAALVQDADDILAEYEFLIAPHRKLDGGRVSKQQESRHVELSPEEQQIMAILGDGECGVDGLIRESGLMPSAVSSLLLQMEMKRLVRMLPGRIVEAC